MELCSCSTAGPSCLLRDSCGKQAMAFSRTVCFSSFGRIGIHLDGARSVSSSRHRLWAAAGIVRVPWRSDSRAASSSWRVGEGEARLVVSGRAAGTVELGVSDSELHSRGEDGREELAVELQQDNESAEEEAGPTKSESKRNRRARLERELLELGTSPIDVLMLSGEKGWSTEVFWTIVNILAVNDRVPEVLLVFEWWKRQDNYTPRELHYARFIRMCGHAKLVDRAQKLFDEMVSVGIEPTVGTYSCLLQGYAEAGLFHEAKQILEAMLEAGLKPNAVTYTGLLHAYGKHGLYNEMAKVFNDMKTYQATQPDCAPTAVTYSVVVQCYGKGGLFARMEKAFKEMIAKGFAPDAVSVNTLVQAYAESGLLKEMERAYSLIKLYRVGIKVETVRAVALAYIRKSYFYQLGSFVRHVKRNRTNMGNLLENLLLLSQAANFSMRGLAREYILLKDAGFRGDITSFNIRALAFSKMKMFWDLRVTVLEMQHLAVVPDLVTYGAIVDAYVGAGLTEKLPEAMSEMLNLDGLADVRTDALVFEAFGRGEFQLCCEALALEMQDEDRRHLTYANLIGYHLKKVEINGAAST
ncbi:protein MpPPR_6 [Marchantia polymorpha subsp. ruderalis]|uniref:Pentacotripeptide-repeat region of PRORP domain-containing protein n=2 Tax=Marchantia polymorpha TaxID=3197 RepID=A0A176VYW3_MARPO|nr:hypothetical protein AXG93_1712s1690 [Marchantia polymorpha subsp. ruderalis]PTQ49741.1 hypothetical protein MARPO_0002s0203 [Marchantia polymorpha]BBN00143.1 hypothetical protein Mp_1g26750 [Marchantia polymorpha subsp. ruderalis]|eukprot:PTQ49741.1 hypothetical protein MARPO_0002s0203 [Marchantia polymorpha]